MSFSWLGLELGVLGASLAAFAGMARLFTSLESMGTIVVAVLLTHGVCISCRWAKLPAVFAALISGLAVGLSTISAAFPNTVHHLVIPTGATYAELQRVGYEAWNQFVTTRAPTEPVIGFTLAAVTGAWVTAVVSDTIAFRLGFLVEALVPPGVVMVLVAALAPPRYRLEAVLAFAVSVALVVTSARVRELSREAWLGRRPRRAGAIGAALFIASALTATGYVATHPPDWATSGIIDLQGESKTRGVRDRSTGDPMVSTRARLVEQSEVKMFTIKWPSGAPYWRQTTLEVLNDESWRPAPSDPQPQVALSDDSSGDSAADASGDAVITIQSLRSKWLPVPDDVAVISKTDGASVGLAADVQRDTQTGGFIVSRMSKDAVYYARTSDSANAAKPGDEGLLRIDGISPRVVATAQEITAGATTPEEKATALQKFFLSNFTYDLDVALTAKLGLEDFLFTERRGYCEQFASSFAIMARAVGLPSRVAVGFVRGDFGSGSGVWQIRGRDAHAWPEVLIDGKWTRFEPTPGRADGSVASTTTLPPTTLSPTVTTTPFTVTTLASPTASAAPETVSEPLNMTPFLIVAMLALVLCIPSAVRRIRFGRGIAADADGLPMSVTRSIVGLEDDLAWIGSPRPSGTPLTRFVNEIAVDSPDGQVGAGWLAAVRNAVKRVETVRYQSADNDPSDEHTETLAAIATARRQVRAATPLSWKVRRFVSFSPRPSSRDRKNDSLGGLLRISRGRTD